jgi:hypothetical protein
VRGIYPTVATITAAGFEPVEEEEVARRFAAVVAGLEGAAATAGGPR